MNILIPGGSGQVGTILARAFHADGHNVTVLSRRPHAAPWNVEAWDAETLGPWVRHLDAADVVVNLAGRSVNCRYTAANRRDIMESRVRSTRAVGQAIARSSSPPRVWLQMSTATIYAHRFDAPNDETTGLLGGEEPDAPDTWKFSIDVAKAWEAAAMEFDTPATRKVLMRSAMVMSPDRGGIFDVMLGLVRKGLGGTAGNGRQYLSWIHDRDFLRAVHWLIEHDELDGPVNLCSPNPLPNREFMAELRRAWGTRIGLTASHWMLAIGAWLMRTETELVLKSRRVAPGRLLASGFRFDCADWPAAVADLGSRWQAECGGRGVSAVHSSGADSAASRSSSDRAGQGPITR